MSKVPEDILDVLTAFARRLSDYVPVKKTILYGSYAKGTWKKYSDIDVAVFVPDDTKMAHKEIFRCISRILRDYDYDIQAQVFSETEYHNPVGIVEEIVLYGFEIPPSAYDSRTRDNTDNH